MKYCWLIFFFLSISKVYMDPLFFYSPLCVRSSSFQHELHTWFALKASILLKSVWLTRQNCGLIQPNHSDQFHHFPFRTSVFVSMTDLKRGFSMVSKNKGLYLVMSQKQIFFTSSQCILNLLLLRTWIAQL